MRPKANLSEQENCCQERQKHATVTCRMMGPDGVSSCSRIGQRLFMFLMKCLNEYLGKTMFKQNPGKYLVYTLGRIEVRR